MISYAITKRELHRRISEQLPITQNRDGKQRKNARAAWLTRAARETRRLRDAGTYSKTPEEEIWSELKPIFSDIQGDGKCAYCERKLARYGTGNVDGDIDHYRPKDGVKDWPTAHDIPTGGNNPHNYYLLALRPRNYILSCRVCNQGFKRSYFPIAAQRCSPHGSSPGKLRVELPYLIHPLDPSEPDPEELIEYYGIVPVPRARLGTHDYWRAKVTIDLLGLSSGNRGDLDRERAEVITRLYLALLHATASSLDPILIGPLADLDNDSLPHRNCARSFVRLYKNDPAKARLHAVEAQKLISAYPAQQQIDGLRTAPLSSTR